MDFSPLVCRDATIVDAPAIARVNVAAWQAAYAGLMPADFLARLDRDAVQARWEKLLEAGLLLLVVESQDDVVGFCLYGPSRDRDAGPATGEVIAINLHPSAWRKGLGTELFNEALGRLRGRGFTEATLWVLHGNIRARRFYERLGWQPDGTERHDSSLTGFPLHEVRYRADLGGAG
jgi:ribosomal protein S18 acetylase RimI-like enzyme